MDPTRYSTIAHRDHIFCCPLSEEKADRIVEVLDLTPGARVLDAGCGKGEFLVRIVKRYATHGVGVEANPVFLEDARARAGECVAGGSIEFRQAAVADLPAATGSFDAALCLGSTRAWSSYREALRGLRRLVRPGGIIVAGEHHWKRPPATAYLDAIGAKAGDFHDLAGNIAVVVDEGLTPLYSVVSSEDDWDHYEGLFALSIERYVAENPRDPDADAMRARVLLWRDAYLRWGRNTLGYGVCVMRV